jgi:predicted CXXCH cytochrome family protein
MTSSPTGLLAAAALSALAACAAPHPAGGPTAPAAGALVVPLTVTAASDPSCWRCHEAKLGAKARGKVVHAPFRQSAGCVACHGAHAGPPSKAGLAVSQPELCRRCHRAERFRGPNLHAAIEGGGCTACHDPHGGDERRLLSSSADALCATCHDVAAVKQHGGLAVPGGRCVLCHDPHGAPRPKLLRAVVHEPLSDCGSCHAPARGAPLARSAKEPALCLQCHDGVERELAR